MSHTILVKLSLHSPHTLSNSLKPIQPRTWTTNRIIPFYEKASGHPSTRPVPLRRQDDHSSLLDTFPANRKLFPVTSGTRSLTSPNPSISSSSSLNALTFHLSMKSKDVNACCTGVSHGVSLWSPPHPCSWFWG